VKTFLHIPVVASHESTVQPILSSQFFGVNWQVQESAVLTKVATVHLSLLGGAQGGHGGGGGGGGGVHFGLVRSDFLTHLLSLVSQDTE
jgi:uncharacterized membrane protein